MSVLIPSLYRYFKAHRFFIKLLRKLLLPFSRECLNSGFCGFIGIRESE